MSSFNEFHINFVEVSMAGVVKIVALFQFTELKWATTRLENFYEILSFTGSVSKLYMKSIQFFNCTAEIKCVKVLNFSLIKFLILHLWKFCIRRNIWNFFTQTRKCIIYALCSPAFFFICCIALLYDTNWRNRNRFWWSVVGKQTVM